LLNFQKGTEQELSWKRNYRLILAKKEERKPEYGKEEITIRTMVEADIFYLTKFLMDPVVLGWFPMSNLKEVQDATKVWLAYARKNASFTLEINGVPAGMAIVYVNSFEKLKDQSLFAIVVDAKHRGRGAGSKLLRFIMKQARDTFNIKLFHLEVYEGNPAYNLYYREGFREYGKHEKFLKNADGTYGTKIFMQVDLTQLEL